jgi:uncharacterized small protein (DUF1192 family)
MASNFIPILALHGRASLPQGPAFAVEPYSPAVDVTTTATHSMIGWKGCRDHRSVAVDEDVPIRKKVLHEIGQDLSQLSVEELSERIELLQEEVARLDAARSSKRASRTTADQFFKK